MRVMMGLLLLLFATLTTSADTLFPYVGTITLTGPSVIETIDVSFDFTPIYGGFEAGTVSDLELSSNGPLIFGAIDGEMLPDNTPGYLALLDQYGDDLDLLELTYLYTPQDVPTMSANMYSCNSQPCIADFGGEGCAYFCGQSGFVTANITDPVDTPEPSMLVLLLFGLSVVIFVKELYCATR